MDILGFVTWEFIAQKILILRSQSSNNLAIKDIEDFAEYTFASENKQLILGTHHPI